MANLLLDKVVHLEASVVLKDFNKDSNKGEVKILLVTYSTNLRKCSMMAREEVVNEGLLSNKLKVKTSF